MHDRVPKTPTLFHPALEEKTDDAEAKEVDPTTVSWASFLGDM